ncbi:MAG: hypothetical protein ACFFG0_26435, partial [Candidatus Thorarchaeota archaeon]
NIYFKRIRSYLIMNYKKIILICSLFLLLIPITNVKAFVYTDYIKDGNYAFFLFDLQEGNNTQISLNHEDSGNFTIFLFNKRPTKSYVNGDKSLDNTIFSKTSLVDYSLSNNPYINYTAPEAKIYYVEIILVGDGPDTYNLTIVPDDYSVTRYYLPIIPGFRLEILLFTIVLAVGAIFILTKKKFTRQNS